MRKLDIWLFVFVLSLASIAAAGMFWGYYQHPDLVWRGDASDRNEHFSLGLRLALALRNGDLAWFLYEIEFATIWPPFHGLVLSAVLLTGGLDVRLGIIPSLIGWTATVSMIWVIARRYFQDPIVGIVGASVATIFALASPTFRMLATDIMLEGLGSALTTLAVYFYMQTYAHSEEALWWRLLAITLTLLFFEKYNYWGITFFSLALAHILQHRHELFARARPWRNECQRVAGVVARDPAVPIFAMLAGLVLFFYWRGPEKFSVFGWQISTYPPNNLTTIAYAVIFVRLSIEWFRQRRVLDAELGVAGRAIFYWHLVPVAASFLIPRRLSWFLWEVGPTNSWVSGRDPLSGLAEYTLGLTEGFTVAPWAAAAAVLLALHALSQWKRFAPECQATFVLVVSCAVLVILHPNHQARFLASWVFALWICAGVGAALIFEWTTKRISSPHVRAALAGFAIAGFALATHVTKPSPAAASHAHQSLGPSEFDLLPAYLPYLATSSRIGVLPAKFGKGAFLLWNASLQCRCRIAADPTGDLRGLSHDETVTRISSWLRNTDSDVVVGIFTPDNLIPNDWLIEAMKAHDRFRLIANSTVSTHRADVMVWRR